MSRLIQALRVPCPECGADPGRPCRREDGPHLAHRSRVDLIEERQTVPQIIQWAPIEPDPFVNGPAVLDALGLAVALLMLYGGGIWLLKWMTGA